MSLGTVQEGWEAVRRYLGVWPIGGSTKPVGLGLVTEDGQAQWGMLYTFTSYSTFYELYVALLKATIAAAVALSVLVSLDRLWKVSSYLHLCFKGWKHGWSPEKEFGFQPLPDPAKYSLVYPRVAVQLPMFNEKAVCQAIIDSACELAWPRERFCVQVIH